jgi:glucan-binding YG repeat protein
MRTLWKKLAAYGTCSMLLIGAVTCIPGTPVQMEAMAQTNSDNASFGWQKELDGWRLKNSDGSYAKGCFGVVDNIWYYFDQDGYMVTGWQQVDNDWFYFEADGHMVTGPTYVGQTYYYFENSGKLNKSFYE